MILAIFSALPGLAYEPVLGWNPFETGPEQARLLAENAYDDIPQPIVSMVSVKRDGQEGDASCGNWGIIGLSYAIPDSSPLDLFDVGLHLRVAEGDETYEIFSEDAVMPLRPEPGAHPRDPRRACINFDWDDERRARQKPLDLRIEARVIAPNGRLGPPAVFEIKSVPVLSSHSPENDDLRR